MLVGDQVGGLHHLAADDPALEETVEHLVRRPVTQPAGQERKQAPGTVDRVLAVHRRRPLVVLDTQHRAVVAEPFLGRRNEGDPSVAAAMRPHAGRRTAVALGMHARVLDPQQRQDGGERLQLRGLDEAAAPALETRDQGRESGDEGADATGVAEDVSRRLERRSPLLTVQAGVARQGLRHQLRADEPGIRAAQAERRDRHHNEPREPLSQIRERETPAVELSLAPIGHQNIGPPQEIKQWLGVRAGPRQRHRPLVGGYRLPEQRLQRGPDLDKRTHAPKTRSFLGFQDNHVGAPKSELPAAVRGRDAVGELKDADPPERRPRLRSLQPTTRSACRCSGGTGPSRPPSPAAGPRRGC